MSGQDYINNIKNDLNDYVLPASLEELIEVTNLDVTQVACVFEI